uniref:Retrovirus-related Pol polyprotein from transposon TNT 1-94-like beta-barrel domain-containing protein n=1 Tax=Cajanus cajan TaxID=3821 RepID=A0A151RFF6_CAJCA|nr:hypothetical protein KK1_037264 [Cajanus cajan]
MKIFIESIHRNIWQVVITDYKIPTINIEVKIVEKPFGSWELGEIRRAKKLILSVSLRAKQTMWYMDNDCSKHMTGDKSKFITLQENESGRIAYEDNNKGKILGLGTISNNSNTLIEDVLYVEGLKYNLLSIRQLCDENYKVSFNNECFMICDKTTNETLFVSKRINNIYILDLDHTPSTIHIFPIMMI